MECGDEEEGCKKEIEGVLELEMCAVGLVGGGAGRDENCYVL